MNRPGPVILTVLTLIVSVVNGFSGPPVDGENVIVYHEPGRFAAWPANNGVWIWGDEILVGLDRGYYVAKDNSHSIDRDREEEFILARSLDGGRTWKVEDPENFVNDGLKPTVCPGGIDFSHPDFALRVGKIGVTTSDGSVFFYSIDRGHTWKGPYQLPDFGGKQLTARTDYLVEDSDSCQIFVSAKEPLVQAGIQDRAFAIRTDNGGQSFEFVSWITDAPIEVRSVMPSTARISPDTLVSTLRRRLDFPGGGNSVNFIDAYRSTNNGRDWKFLSRVAYTSLDSHNGNPPSLVRLRDGRLVVTYGYRDLPFGIRARMSSDNGENWGPEISLRDDGRTWDLGYTRSVQRRDGKIVTIYYFTTKDRPEQHIAATIWEP